MKKISQNTRKLFERWGKRGGEARSKKLSSHERSVIASKAARSRWKNDQRTSTPALPSIRLENADINDPVYLEELFSEGTLADWKDIYRIVSDRPFGETASAVEKVCSSVRIYGITKLWQGILRTVRGGIS